MDIREASEEGIDYICKKSIIQMTSCAAALFGPAACSSFFGENINVSNFNGARD
jgi:hypothetical protein